MDSLIEGIDYNSGSTSGVTTATGGFQWEQGSQVTFSIGNLVLGTSNGGTLISIVDLVPGATGANNSKVMNLARFLQSLDTDCNPANGIQISAQTRSIVGAYAVDFAQSPNFFGRDANVAAIFEALNAAGVYTGGCVGMLRSVEDAVVNTDDNLQNGYPQGHLQQSLNEVNKLMSGSVDWDSDGEIDGTIVVQRDDVGRVAVIEDYTPSDSGDHYVKIYTYDTQNRVLTEREERNGGGSLECYSYIYDDGLREKTQVFDRDCDSVIDSSTRWAYDPNGRLVREEQDWDADGTPNSVTRFLYDGANLSHMLRDWDNDGADDADTWYQYGEGLLVTKDEIDLQNGGIVTYRYSYTYDALGYLASYTADQNNDGLPEIQRFTSNDSQGRVLSTITWNGQTTGSEREYDLAGDMIRFREWMTGEFPPDPVDDTTIDWLKQSGWMTKDEIYDYDANHRKIFMSAMWNDEGWAFFKQYEYDEYGNIIRVLQQDFWSGYTSEFLYEWTRGLEPGGVYVPGFNDNIEETSQPE
jgi:hypothetical protein